MLNSDALSHIHSRSFVCCDQPLANLRALVNHFEERHVNTNPSQVSGVPSTLDLLDFAPKEQFLQAEEDVLQRVADIVQIVSSGESLSNEVKSRSLTSVRRSGVTRPTLP